MVRNWVKLASIVLVAAVLASAASIAAPALANHKAPATKSLRQWRGVGPVKAAEELVSRVKNLISRINGLVSKYNISLPANLSSRVSLAEKLVNEAAAKVNSSPKEAIKLAVKAARTLVPVTIYVIKSLPPGVREELFKERINATIVMEGKIIRRVEGLLKWFKGRAGFVPPQAIALLHHSKILLMRAEKLLSNGSLRAAEELSRRAGAELGAALMIMRREAGVAWLAATATDLIIKHLVLSTGRICLMINESVTMLENNNTKGAEELLNKAYHESTWLLLRLRIITNRLMGVMPAVRIPRNLTKVFRLSYEILKSLSISINQSLKYVVNGNVSGAELTLIKALRDVNPLMSNLTKTARWAHEMLVKVRAMMGRVEGRLAVIVRRHKPFMPHPPLPLRSIPRILKIIKSRVEEAYKLYSNGTISAGRYRSVLIKADHALHAVLNALKHAPVKPPKKLVNEVMNLLKFVESQLSSIKGNKPALAGIR